MSIYRELLDAVSNGSRFKIDLVEKSLTIDRKKIIEKGEILNEAKDLIERWDLANEIGSTPLDFEPWVCLECLYRTFKTSVPREHSLGNNSYFKSKSSDELSLREMSFNEDREYAQAKLEGYILLASLQGWLNWNNDNHWFWQSKDEPQLIVLRRWVE